jgi:DUF971 family protein
MTIAADLRRRPSSVKVHVSTGEGVEIAWADGHPSRYTFVYLRDECPCAVCNDERTKKDRNASKGLVALPIFKAKVKARSARAVGSYAIQIDFSDGHTTGIYSFEFLRSICPCPECKPPAL